MTHRLDGHDALVNGASHNHPIFEEHMNGKLSWWIRLAVLLLIVSGLQNPLRWRKETRASGAPCAT